MESYAFYIGGIQLANIDEATGVIKDVRLITEGSALGHNVDIDATTIDQIVQCAASYKNGVKVKLNHDGGAGDIPGYVNNIRKMQDGQGEYLIGDLNLFANHPQRNYILELAKTIPDTFGLSCFFIGKPDMVDNRKKARCARLFSCDLVTEPAANPSLFSIGPVLRSTDIATEKKPVDKPKKNMTPQEFAACMQEYEKNKALAGTGTAVVPTKETHQVNEDGSEKHVITKGPTAPAPEEEEDDEEEKMAMRLSAKILAGLVKGGVRIAPSVTQQETVALAAKPEVTIATKTFEDMCHEFRTKGDENGTKLSATDAITHARKQDPAAHRKYLELCKAEGEQQYEHMQLSRASSVNGAQIPEFKSKVEHWKVQGTPKPANA